MQKVSNVFNNKGGNYMSLIPYEPFRQLSNMRKEFDRFFTDFPLAFGTEHHVGGIRVDVHIDIENNMLMISGSINRTNEEREENMFRKERYVGRFQRAVSLPSPVSHEGVKASYRNGVLEVKMPKLSVDTKTKIDVDFH